ncbi:MAG: hypothetical protein K8H90_01640, partial [Thermoanaerobaculia bacterium]|nr:hypothetical protein [Thermoanaerobaculia bacterium]
TESGQLHKEACGHAEAARGDCGHRIPKMGDLRLGLPSCMLGASAAAERRKHRLRMLIPYWSRLADLGNSKVLRTSYFWLFAVPLAASALSKLGQDHRVMLFGTDWVLHLALPFSWRCFYLASLAFAAATGLFALRCPEMVRRYRSYADFKAEGKGGSQVRDYYLAYCLKHRIDRDSVAQLPKFIHEFTLEHNDPRVQSWSFPTSSMEHNVELVELLSEVRVEPATEAEAFWHVHQVLDKANRLSACVCAVLFLLGITLAGIVMIQNFLYVWRVAS